MVVLTVVVSQNGQTVYSDEPIPKANYVRLTSCSFYNSWHNLNCIGTLIFQESGRQLVSLPQGHYTVESLAKELTDAFQKNKVTVDTEISKPNSVLKITNPESAKVLVDHDLSILIGSGRSLKETTFV